MLHGDDASEAAVLESLKTGDLFSSRRIVIYHEPDFLQPGEKREELGQRLEKAVTGNKKERAVKILAKILRRSRISPDRLAHGNRDIIKKLALPASLDLSSVLELIEEYKEKPELLQESGATRGELLLEWLAPGKSSRKRKDIFLAIHVERPDRRNRILKALMKICPVTDLAAGRDRSGRGVSRLRDYVKGWLSESGKSIEGNALKFLIEKVGEVSPSALKNEVEKLVSQSGHSKTISLEDVRKLVVRHREEEIFRITDAVRTRNASRAVTSLRMVMDQGIHPLAVLSAVRNVMLRIFALKVAVSSLGLEGRIEGSSYNVFKSRYWDELRAVFPDDAKGPLVKQHPYAAFLNVSAVGNFSWKEILGMLEEMAHMDFALKGGKMPPGLVLESFFMRNL